MNSIDYNKILTNAFSDAKKAIEEDGGKQYLNKLNTNQKEWLNKIVEKAESLKAVVTVLATSLVKKIENPKQDVRYHKRGLPKGYSGRTLDTNYVTPFFKIHFRRLAMKESGWLTRSIEQPSPFTKDFPGKIRDSEVKRAFLSILDDLETNKTDPEIYLISLFILLLKFTSTEQTSVPVIKSEKSITVTSIVDLLKKHFNSKYTVSGASMLPVIALYSIYQILINDLSRFKNKKLLPLRSHLSPDTRAGTVGDIEVVDDKGEYFEAVEVKHGIPIDSFMVLDAYEKFKDTRIKRYYLLTTAEPNIKHNEEDNIVRAINYIRNKHGCEVLVNGVLYSLKYYLRLLDDPNKFIENYTKNLEIEFSKTTEIKKEHVEKWEELLHLLMG
ncbi:MAG: DNA methyltransferase [Nitrososphaeria archaeon]